MHSCQNNLEKFYTSAEAAANCVAQMGALNAAEPLSDGYTVQAQSVND